MHQSNILIGVDQKYYDEWGINLITSILHHNPFIQCHVHIVNPFKSFKKIKNVDYTTENKSFINETNKLGYLQAVRFLKVAEKFNKNDLVMTLDADTICTKSFSEESFYNICKDVNVLKHNKDHRWLAGCITFGTENFKKEFSDFLKHTPIDDWEFGQDQKVLPLLANKYQFKEVSKEWISIGKNRRNSAFFTLKGNQKIKEKYLKTYKGYLK